MRQVIKKWVIRFFPEFAEIERRAIALAKREVELEELDRQLKAHYQARLHYAYLEMEANLQRFLIQYEADFERQLKEQKEQLSSK